MKEIATLIHQARVVMERPNAGQVVSEIPPHGKRSGITTDCTKGGSQPQVLQRAVDGAVAGTNAGQQERRWYEYGNQDDAFGKAEHEDQRDSERMVAIEPVKQVLERALEQHGPFSWEDLGPLALQTWAGESTVDEEGEGQSMQTYGKFCFA